MDWITIVDLSLLVLFFIVAGIFLYKKRKNVEVQAKIIFLYKTKIGVKFMEKFALKHPKLLRFLQYPIIGFGCLAIIFIYYLLIDVIIKLFQLPSVTKVPPIMPLIPYLPEIFDIALPSIRFIPFLLIILIVASIHEFSHGIYAIFYKMKVKATGFGLMGPFPLAFVELDEKKLAKKKIKQQLSVLAAGTFSNFITSILFLIIIIIFSMAAFSQGGIVYYHPIIGNASFSEIQSVNVPGMGNLTIESFLDLPLETFEKLAENKETTTIFTSSKKLFINNIIYSEIYSARDSFLKNQTIRGFEDTEEFQKGFIGIVDNGIMKINNYPINSREDYNQILTQFSPGDEMEITTSKQKYILTLSEDKQNPGKPMLNIKFIELPKDNFMIKLSNPVLNLERERIPLLGKEFTDYISDFLFWLFIISFFIAFFNMISLPIFDGGKFLHLLAFKIFKSEKAAIIVSKIANYIIILIFTIIMFIWIIKPKV